MVINLFIGRAGIPLPGFRQDALRCPLAPAEEGNLHQGEQAAPFPIVSPYSGSWLSNQVTA